MIQTAPDLLATLNGDAMDRLLAHNCDIGALRPWKGRDGRSYIQVNVYDDNKQPVLDRATGLPKTRVLQTNASSILPRDALIKLDTKIITRVKDRLKLVGEIRNRGLVMNMPNGMAHTMLEYRTSGDITRATISMDPTRRSEVDRPTGDSAFFPLPICHKDFDFTWREMAGAQLTGMPLDIDVGALAAEKVAEEIEMLATGTNGTFSFGGGTIYGAINAPFRAPKIDMPVPDGTNGPAVLAAIAALKQLLINDRHRGPYMLYLNSQWSTVLNLDYSTVKGEGTLRERILKDPDIQGIEILDYLPTTLWHCVLMEMKEDTVRAVVSFEVQTVQWESLGGMMRHFKVMAGVNIQYRPDTAGNSGIAHGTTAAFP